MPKLAKKHLLSLSRAMGLWTVQSVTHAGAGKVEVTLAGRDMVLLDPATARAFGNALLDASAEAMIEP